MMSDTENSEAEKGRRCKKGLQFETGWLGEGVTEQVIFE